MITVRIKGGLGNQLFQYAAGYALAKRLGQKMQLDTSFFPGQNLRGFKLTQLNIAYTETVENLNAKIAVYKNRYLNKLLRRANVRVLTCGKTEKYLLETRSDIVSEYFTINSKNIYLDGYYQSDQYFGNYRESLREQFRPKYTLEDECAEKLDMILNCNSVAVHVRRGDFLQAQNDRNPNHYLLGEAYYHNALRYIQNHTENATFFWFSDDIEWVKRNFGEQKNFYYVRLHTTCADIDEMMLMKKCCHIIAANSTFSWWASWLNERDHAVHICPAKRYGNLHMIPAGWVKIPVE